MYMSKNNEAANKKTVTIPVKISFETETELREICNTEDRPRGYVARELMLRGLNLYKQDGKLKDAPSDTSYSKAATNRKEVRDPAKTGGTKNTQVIKGRGIVLDTTRKVKT